jgi:hypothetical protein
MALARPGTHGQPAEERPLLRKSDDVAASRAPAPRPSASAAVPVAALMASRRARRAAVRVMVWAAVSLRERQPPPAAGGRRRRSRGPGLMVHHKRQTSPTTTSSPSTRRTFHPCRPTAPAGVAGGFAAGAMSASSSRLPPRAAARVRPSAENTRPWPRRPVRPALNGGAPRCHSLPERGGEGWKGRFVAIGLGIISPVFQKARAAGAKSGI